MPKVRRTRKPTAKTAPLTPQALLSAVHGIEPVVPPSDGLVTLEQSATPPTPWLTPEKPAGETYKKLPQDSIVRQKAMHIIAMRMAGIATPEIAKALDIKEKSVNQYLYLAGRNGWLSDSENWADPADRLEFELSHKVVRNLNNALDEEATRPIGKDSITLEVAKGTLFKKFGEQQAAGPALSNMLAIKIEVVGNPTSSENIIASGEARYIEGETI